MRLHLCAVGPGGVEILETRTGPGAKDVVDHEAAFFDAAEPWFARHGDLAVVLSGMIGSTIGWRETEYAPCPATAAAVRGRLTRLSARGRRIHIVPGLSSINLFGLPDVMRGEEVQLFGWLSGVPIDDDRDRLICLPGTHAKWVRATGRGITTFMTSMQGELFELLLTHSLLGRSLPKAVANDPPHDADAFVQGVGVMADNPDIALEHAIFSMRSRILVGDLVSQAAPAFLSGLLIGAELRDGVRAHAALGVLADPLILIGGEGLVDRYATAAARLGIPVEAVVDGDLAVRGLVDALGAGASA